MSTCFVIMPITTPPHVLDAYGDDENHFGHVLEHLFKPAIEQAGYDFIPPTVVNSEVIQATIIWNLEKADLVLCDISDWNANVFFELGIRVALDRPVALVKDSLTDLIPFDNASVSCHTYDSRLHPWVLSSEVPDLAQFIQAASEQERNALWRYFGITQRAKESEPGDATQAKLDLVMAELTSLRETMTGSQTATVSSSTRQEGLRRLVQRLEDMLVGVGLAQTRNSVTGDWTTSSPQVISVAEKPWRFTIRTLPGQILDDFVNAAPRIANNLDVVEVHVEPVGPSLIELRVVPKIGGRSKT